jgi:hypothetical protein
MTSARSAGAGDPGGQGTSTRQRIWQWRQLRQTVIATGVIGAVVGALPWLGMLVFDTGGRSGVVHARPLLSQLVEAAAFVLACVVGCVVLFGLLPMALQYAFIRGVQWWTGRD